MRIPPTFEETPVLSFLLGKIETFRNLSLEKIISSRFSRNLRRKSLLGSSLFSARIEGNSLGPEKISLGILRSKEKEKLEVGNLFRALNYVYENYHPQSPLVLKDFLLWHQTALRGISSEAGKLRREMGGIFDAFGNLIHFSVSPPQIAPHLEQLLDYVNGDVDRQRIPIKACLAHYVFEKIHPFLDANGRVGRLLLSCLLNQYGYTLGGTLVFEEYLDDHRGAYYKALEEKGSDLSGYLEFMLKALEHQLSRAKDGYLNMAGTLGAREAQLLPRRLEILQIIREHQLVNFDFIRRRFLTINERTLRFDLKRLAEEGYIVKRGETRGVFYNPSESL